MHASTARRLRALTLAALLQVATQAAHAADPVKILFVGNSFTFAANSPVRYYRSGSVTDLNNEGQGGMPALFKSFADQAGLEYDVYLETRGGTGIDCDDKNPCTDDGCDDKNACTKDACDKATGCVNTADDTAKCDDGNKSSNDGCSSACLSEYCGDELVQSGLGEECDNGIDNADAPDACRLDCKSPRCGDGITDPSNGEDCDDGNSVDTDGCTNGCTICGDNVRKGTEECDGTDLGTAVDDVRSRLDRVRGRLPEEADPPTIFRADSNAFPIMQIGVEGDLDPVTLRELAENDLSPRLERAPGVAAVTLEEPM